MLKHFLLLPFLCLICGHVHSQKIIYLNKDSEITEDIDTAIEYAVMVQEGKLKNIDFFTMDSILTRSSQYLQFGKTPDKQILHGKTTYRYKHIKQDSLECYYNNNMRLGAATFYYPDGKVHVSCAYKQGNLDGLLMQYYPNGNIKRKDIYEKGVAIATTIYSEEGELLGNSPFYVAPTPLIGMQMFIQSLSKEVKFPYDQLKEAGVWEIFIEATIDNEGKFKKVRVLKTTHKALIMPTLTAANHVFQANEFLPATMDNQSVTGTLTFPLTYHVEKTIQKKIVKKSRKTVKSPLELL